jgi:hypothetical protein
MNNEAIKDFIRLVVKIIPGLFLLVRRNLLASPLLALGLKLCSISLVSLLFEVDTKFVEITLLQNVSAACIWL